MGVVISIRRRNFGAMMLLLLLVIAATGVSSKNSNSAIKFKKFEVYDLPAIQWACEPFLEPKQSIETNLNKRSVHPFKEQTRKLCMKLRGGKVVKESDNNELVVDDNNAEGAAENRNSSFDESMTNDCDESDTVEAPSSHEINYVPSAAPTSSVTTGSKKNYTFSVFQEGDGHETDPDGIPTRYLVMQNNKRDAAKTALEKTVEWRKENDIDTILARPHPKYDVSKAVFPHYFCGRDDTQHVILLQRPGLMNVKLASKNDLSGEELLFHYIYVMEYLWRIIDPAPDATMTSIIDLTEMNISILRKREQLRIGSLFLSTMDAHFPQRSHRTYLINAPKWFGALYKLASPLLRESTKEKIQILSKGKEQDEVLKNLLQDCPIPEGEKYENVPAGVMEEELRNFVSLLNVSIIADKCKN